MKKVLLICCFCYLLCLNSSGQRVTYKDLVGTAWFTEDTSASQAMTFRFMDSTHLLLSSSIPKINMTEESIFSYLLDTSSDPTLLHFEGVSKENIRINSYLFIKIENNSTLKLQGDWNGSKPTKWDDKETDKNTLVMTRVK